MVVFSGARLKPGQIVEATVDVAAFVRGGAFIAEERPDFFLVVQARDQASPERLEKGRGLDFFQVVGQGDFDVQVGQESAIMPKPADSLLQPFGQTPFSPGLQSKPLKLLPTS